VLFIVFIRGLTDGSELLHGFADQEFHVHVPAVAEGRLEFFQHQEHFSIVGPGVRLRLDIHRRRLAGVGTFGKIGASDDMRM
jgi:hypothetical protein